MQTSIANSLDNAGDEAKLDRNVKKIFSHEAVLAPLMRMCIPEFQGFTDEYIVANCFTEKPEFSKIAVHQDEGGKLDGNQRITQMNSEDNASNEQVIHYDIRFTAIVPDSGQKIKVVVNLEIQNDRNLGYRMVTRGLYYCSRMISAQYGTVFTHQEYDRIQKVYSIWICPDSESKKNSITEYTVQETNRLGNNVQDRKAYDKLQVIIITLGPGGLDSVDELIRYLSLLLSNEKPLDERKKQLEDEYRIEMTYELGKEMSSVCNLGEAIALKNREEGRIEGRNEGRIEGRSEGENRLGRLITKLMASGRSPEEITKAANDPKYREMLYAEFGIA